MDAKSIWIPATSRTNYSSTHTMNNREKQKKLRAASIKKNKENQKLQKGAIGRTKNTNSKINKPVEKKKVSTKGMTAQERAKAAAKARIAAKKAGTYKKPMTAKEMAKKRLKIKK